MITAFLMSNKLIKGSTEIRLETYYKTVPVFWFGLVSIIMSMVTILIGLGWNQKNISYSKGPFFAVGNLVIICTFTLLAWIMIAISLAEWAFLVIMSSIIIGAVTLGCIQRKDHYKLHPFFFGIISVFVPIVTLPSTQEKNKKKQKERSFERSESSESLNPKETNRVRSSHLSTKKSLEETISNSDDVSSTISNNEAEAGIPPPNLEKSCQNFTKEKLQKKPSLSSNTAARLTTKDTLGEKETVSSGPSSHKNWITDMFYSVKKIFQTNPDGETTLSSQKSSKKTKKETGKNTNSLTDDKCQ
jgi:uncharacterized membrane protein YhaH (DUF805 family)